MYLHMLSPHTHHINTVLRTNVFIIFCTLTLILNFYLKLNILYL